MTDRNDVPCNGCTACCRGERVILAHGIDDPSKYWWVPSDLGMVLAHKPNGECVYLTASGCTIHDHAPYACQQFDCRKWVRREREAMVDLLIPDDLNGEVRKAALKRL